MKMRVFLMHRLDGGRSRDCWVWSLQSRDVPPEVLGLMAVGAGLRIVIVSELSDYVAGYVDDWQAANRLAEDVRRSGGDAEGI